MEQANPLPSFAVPVLGPQMQRLIECNQKLTELGIENTVQLPKICVVGDQSAGKSSLIEALSRIRVPRAANCCTRCPLEINLSCAESRTSPWRCKISLVKSYNYDHQHKGREPDKKFPMGPWVRTDQETYHFAESGDQEEVRDLIYRAQLATLNPGVDHTHYILTDEVDTAAEPLLVKFSPNIVRIDISCGVWVSLSFMDLPGVISVADSPKERNLVKLVENLVKHYAQSASSINLLALPMSDDVANSRALSIIQDLKAEKQTLGVLTKPDRVQNQESREPYLDMLRGNDAYQLQHGFHVVMMPPDVHISWDEARAKEMEHFDSEPWRNPEFSDRVGMDLLAAKLRLLLQQKIGDNLPHIREMIGKKLSSVEMQLKGYPTPPPEGRLEAILIMLLMRFQDIVKKLFLEGASDYKFKSKWKKLADKFKSKLDALQPIMTPSTEAEQRRMERAEKTLSRIQSNSSPQPSPVATKTRQQDVLCISSDEEPDPRAKGRPPKQDSKNYQKSKTFSITEVHEIHHGHYSGGLPTLIVPDAIKAMNEICLASWKQPLNDFMNGTATLVKNSITEVTLDVFREYRDMLIYKEVVAATKRFLDVVFEEQMARSNEIFDMERSDPFTLDSASLNREKQRVVPALQQERLEYRQTLRKTEQDAAQGGKKTGRNLKQEELPEESRWNTEMDMMARVQAYYVIACSRFADHVCQSIQAKLFTKCGKGLSEALEAQLVTLEQGNFERIVDLMTEDPKRERERLSLQQQKQRLQAALREVEEVLGNGGADRRSSSPSPEDGETNVHTASKVKKETEYEGGGGGTRRSDARPFPAYSAASPMAGRRRDYEEMKHG